MQRKFVSDTCEVICEDNGRKIVAEVISFQEKQYISVSLDRKMKLNLNWNGKIYEGAMSQLTFVSNGPDITFFKVGRR